MWRPHRSLCVYLNNLPSLLIRRYDANCCLKSDFCQNMETKRLNLYFRQIYSGKVKVKAECIRLHRYPWDLAYTVILPLKFRSARIRRSFFSYSTIYNCRNTPRGEENDWRCVWQPPERLNVAQSDAFAVGTVEETPGGSLAMTDASTQRAFWKAWHDNRATPIVFQTQSRNVTALHSFMQSRGST